MLNSSKCVDSIRKINGRATMQHFTLPSFFYTFNVKKKQKTNERD